MSEGVGQRWADGGLTAGAEDRRAGTGDSPEDVAASVEGMAVRPLGLSEGATPNKRAPRDTLPRSN